MTPSWKRTKCGCSTCSSHCLEQPGYLIPGDFERIRDYLDAAGRGDEVTNFVASPGAVVANSETGVRSRVGTIVPARRPDGACAFLDAQGRCTIHEVAPYGCAFFDSHMTKAEGSRRSIWGIRQIIGNRLYTLIRNALPEATAWRPRSYR